MTAATGVRWYALDVNPEPWAVGPLSIGRRQGNLFPSMGRNQQLDAYKSAVRAEIENRYPSSETYILPPSYALEFYFWRNRADYEGETKAVRKNIADATNMQKATEDALQGILIENDRDVVHVESTIVAQGPRVRGAVVIRVEWGLRVVEEEVMHRIPSTVRDKMLGYVVDERLGERDTNAWPPRP